MARRWTPRRFVRLRRIRVAICAVAVALASTVAFGVAARKTIALSINGDTQTVTTYAMSVTRLLEERGVDVKSHDLVQSTSGDILSNHDVVTVRSAYQTTISIDGQRVPFWTVATSASQLLGFFQQNENEAAKVTVDIDNIYSQLTGGLVINESGPVTVIADGKTSVAPNGKLSRRVDSRFQRHQPQQGRPRQCREGRRQDRAARSARHPRAGDDDRRHSPWFADDC